jgi:hypothetical protein
MALPIAHHVDLLLAISSNQTCSGTCLIIGCCWCFASVSINTPMSMMYPPTRTASMDDGYPGHRPRSRDRRPVRRPGLPEPCTPQSYASCG